MHHYRKTIKLYKARKKQDRGCPFCDDPATRKRSVYENEYLYIVPNLTQYDLWEAHEVQDHLLIIPKRHIVSMTELNAKEKLAIMDVIADYEAKGYSVYARGVGFVNHSKEHQHTHLIKVSNKRPKFLIWMDRPYYFLFKR